VEPSKTANLLLRAKLRAPILPSEPQSWVARPRLVEQFSRCLAARLTLISAPPGFGKTSLLAEWLHAAPQPALLAAWLALDAADNELTRFLRYLIAALGPALPEGAGDLLTMLDGPQAPPPQAVLTILLNALGEPAAHICLVLDDYHVIDERQVHDVLTFLLDNLPSRVHVIIATRSDPPLPLARWRARRQLVELRAGDLRFTTDEAAQYLGAVLGVALADADVAALTARTEGWAAGLQMAGLSLQGRSGEEASRFVATFSGTHHFVVDYLLEEVLARQPAYVQEFLLRTAVLDRLTGPLCDAVAPGAAPVPGQELLESLSRANLFLVPLDDERRWFRYHHLFAGLLRARLRHAHADEVPGLHARAAAWFAAAGLIAEAMAHLLAAGDHDRAADLIAQHWTAMAYRGEVGTVLAWLDALPPERIRGDARLSVARCWLYLFRGDLAHLAPAVTEAEAAVQTGSADREPLALLAALRSNLVRLRGELGAALRLGEEALHLAQPGTTAQAAAYSSLAQAQRDAGRFDDAIRSYRASLPLVREQGNRLVECGSAYQMARLLRLQGRLNEAAEVCREVLSAAEVAGAGQHPALGQVHVALADVLRERNDLAGARGHLDLGLELGRRTGQLEALRAAGLVAARLALARGELDAALRSAAEARQAAEQIGAPVLLREAQAVEAGLHARAGRLVEAERWAAETLTYQDSTDEEQLALARTLRANGRTAEAQLRLAQALQAAESAGRQGSAIGILLLRALLHDSGDCPADALPLLERALTLAEPEGYVRVFLDEGLPMLALLRRAAGRGIRPGYIGRLMQAAGAGALPPVPSAAPGPNHSHAAPRLVEPLSERELEVLRLLAGYLSNSEIAERLTVSTGTVKTHIHHIYGKLGVDGRAEAIEAARELRLL
jgi:LuxR family transcriptional regulator, maltose regulon positive regulatory protein